MNYLKNPNCLRVIIEDYMKTDKNEDNYQIQRAKQGIQMETNANVMKPFNPGEVYKKTLQEKVQLANVMKEWKRNNREFKFTQKAVIE